MMGKIDNPMLIGYEDVSIGLFKSTVKMNSWYITHRAANHAAISDGSPLSIPCMRDSGHLHIGWDGGGVWGGGFVSWWGRGVLRISAQ